MRFLFTFLGGSGHFVPLVPIARQAQVMGHTVAFGCGPSMAPGVQAAGFEVFPLGNAGPPPQRMPLRPLDPEREDREFRDGFVRRGAQSRAPHTLDLCRRWRPDVLICDESDFGGMVAAERLGLPHCTMLVMAAGSFVRAGVVGPALNELRASHGLSPDPHLDMLHRYLALYPFPPSFRDPAFPLPANGHAYCPPLDPAPGSAAPWPAQPAHRSTVYFTLGTVYNLESGDLFTRVLDGLRDLPINVVVTVGPHLDPGELGPQPKNVHVESYIPQDTILPYCDLVVSHGGSGSVGGALRHGLPSVLIPMGADQPHNAARCEALGLARVLDPVATTPQQVREAVVDVLQTSSYRQAARHLLEEFLALPGADHAVRLVESVAENCG